MKYIVRPTKFVLLLLFCFFIFTPVTYALSINEICPVSDSNHPYEWVELFNNSDDTVNLNEYSIEDATGKQLKWQSSEVGARQFTIASSSSTLNNDGDTVSLKKNNDNIESISYSRLFTQNESYSRCPDNNDKWIVTKAISFGSSNLENCQVSPTPTTATQIPNSTSQPITVVSQQTYVNIYITEAYVYPQENEDEWIELYNANSYPVLLQNWVLDDIVNGGSSPFSFSISIPANGFGVVTITKTMFNNSGDTILLFDPASNEKDSLIYSVAQKEKSVGRITIGSSSLCIQNPTKGSQNSSCLTENTTKTSPSVTPVMSNQDINTPLPFNTLNQNLIMASNDALLSTGSYNFAPVKKGEVKGITNIPKITNADKKQYQTAQSFASISFMFSWTNICYILIKLHKKKSSIIGS